jgi:hypothetical protein
VDRRRDSYLIDVAVDAAKVTDDFVRGVLGLAAGQIGDDRARRRTWVPSVLAGVGRRSAVQGLGATYAPEQLRKAALQADEFVAAAEDLVTSSTQPALDAAGRLGVLRVRDIPEILRDRDTTSRSPQLRDVHDRLSKAIAVLNAARSAVILAEMRAAREQA